MEKEINIVAPEGFEIDKEHSTFDCIKFKPIEKKRWRYDKNTKIEGYYINNLSEFKHVRTCNISANYNVFATEKQAKSALAMARISQIMANDERFGGVVTDEEWRNVNPKYAIIRDLNRIETTIIWHTYYFLVFHTLEQRDLFLEENKDLVKDYLMID